jgi:hypothetical protein
MAISGNNFQSGRRISKYSYYFSRYPHCWGWASWRRAWRHYDRDLITWEEVRTEGLLQDIAEGDEAFVSYWSTIFDKCRLEQIDTWDYPWIYSCWIQHGLTILPEKNLVANIGFGRNATHTTNASEKTANLPTGQIDLPLTHPPYVIRARQADKYTDRQVVGITESVPTSLLTRIKQRLK